MSSDVVKQTTFVVGIDEDVDGLANFCHFGLCDMAFLANPVIVYGLESKRGKASAPRAVDMVLGRWPRLFSSIDAMADNLAEAVESCLNNYHLISIIVVGYKPDIPKISELLTPVRKYTRESGEIRTKTWILGFFTCGPGKGNSAQNLVSGSGSVLDSVFFAGNHSMAEGYSLGTEDFSKLRLTIDLMRDDVVGRPNLRPSGNLLHRGVIWLQKITVPTGNRPIVMLESIARSFRQIARDPTAGPNSTNKKFDISIGGFLQMISPKREGETAKSSSNSDFDQVQSKLESFKQNWLRDNTLKHIIQASSLVKDGYTAAYDSSNSEIKKLIANTDENFASQLDQFRNAEFPLPGGGYGKDDKSIISEKKKEIEGLSVDWSEAAKLARENALDHNQAIQFKPSPSRFGKMKFDTLQQGKSFHEARDAARDTAAHLPQNRWSVVAVALFPITLAVLLILSHLAGNNSVELDREIGRFLLEQDSIFVAIFTVILFPIFGGVAARSLYKSLASNSFAYMATKAGQVSARLKSMADSTSTYVTNARAVLLASEGTHSIDRRMNDEPVSELKNQVDYLIQNIEGASDFDGTADGEARNIAEAHPPVEWGAKLISAWRDKNNNTGIYWDLTIGGDPRDSNVLYEERGRHDIAVTIANSFSITTSSAVLTPLKFEPERTGSSS